MFCISAQEHDSIAKQIKDPIKKNTHELNSLIISEHVMLHPLVECSP